jgi:hypothetical protein
MCAAALPRGASAPRGHAGDRGYPGGPRAVRSAGQGGRCGVGTQRHRGVLRHAADALRRGHPRVADALRRDRPRAADARRHGHPHAAGGTNHGHPPAARGTNRDQDGPHSGVRCGRTRGRRCARRRGARCGRCVVRDPRRGHPARAAHARSHARRVRAAAPRNDRSGARSHHRRAVRARAGTKAAEIRDALRVRLVPHARRGAASRPSNSARDGTSARARGDACLRRHRRRGRIAAAARWCRGRPSRSCGRTCESAARRATASRDAGHVRRRDAA